MDPSLDTKANIKAQFDKFAQNADYLIASPNSLENAKNMGIAIESKYISNDDFLDELFRNKKTLSQSLIQQISQIDHKIANGTLRALYEELRETFVLGIFGAAITLALIYLELGLKYRLFAKRNEADPNTKWDSIELLDFKATVQSLSKFNLLTKTQKAELDKFNSEVRNKYIHYNIKAIVSNMVLKELPALNLETGKIEIHLNVNAAKMPAVWFSAKKVKDRTLAREIINYCISWVNKLSV